MNEFLLEYGLFFAKSLTFLMVVVVIVGLVSALSRKTRSPEKLEIKDLNRKYDDMRNLLRSHILPAKEWKKLVKRDKSKRKASRKKGSDEESGRVFVLNFHGDIKATGVASLREEITAILTLAEAGDAVLLRLENMGGIVHEHGLAASQVKRLREAGVHVTVAVDKVAASGGYMMACVADRIIAAPFAVLGSIGVLAQLPNFHEMLKRHGIGFEQETAGEFKRTVTMFGENTDKERAKLREQIEQTHELFKAFIAEHRPNLDLGKVATGEIWYGSDAVEAGLIDEIKTSDDYLLEASGTSRLYEVSYRGKKSVSERLLGSINTALDRTVDAARERLSQSPL
ncbi:MAG: protease SohB [Gammaproteobacteria bacterium]|nr:protease SohB [Gammaproteobacteria bacterium]